MVNIRTLGILLDTLQSGDESSRATRPATPVARTEPVTRVARDASQSDLPAEHAGVRTVTADVLARRLPDPGIDLGSDAASTPRAGIAGRAGDVAAAIGDGYAKTPSASLELSATARWLQRSLLTAPIGDEVPSIRASTPLVAAAPGDPGPLAQALRESIAQSGLFYESHLAGWAVQGYPESDLLREPQARWTAAMTAHGESQVTQGAADGSSLAGPPSSGDGRVPIGGQPSVDLMRAQLQTLESRQFSWQGEVWPGQLASMTVAEDRSLPRSDMPPTWRTHLRLTLPELGLVEVDLYLGSAALHLAVAAVAPHSVALLDEARGDLVSALEARTHAVAVVGVRQA